MFIGSRFKIAEIVLGFDSTSPNCFEGLWGSFAPFSVDDRPDVRLIVHLGTLPDLVRGNVVFSAENAWELSSFEAGWIVSLHPREYESTTCVSVFNSDFSIGDVFIRSRDDSRISFERNYPFGQLMLLMINLLNQGRGVLFHGCGIKVGDRGLLFAGVSGAGKTTTANLWKDMPGVTVLSDDRVIVRRREDGRFWLYGTPWHGDAKAASPESAPLDKVFVLNHALANEITSLSPATAIGQLIRCASPAFWSPTGVDFTLQFLESMVQELPTFRYDFVPDPSAVEYIQSL